MNIAFVTSGFLPMPSVMGGAVETLVDGLIKQNEIEKNDNYFTVYTIYNKEAVEESRKYTKTKFVFILIPKIVQIMDKSAYTVIKRLRTKTNCNNYRFIFQRFYFLRKVSKLLKKENFDKLVLENHPTQFQVVKLNNNLIKYKNKIYYHCHNEIKKTFGFEKYFLECKKIISISNFISDSIIKDIKGLEKDKISVLKNCIDTETFNKKIDIDKERKVLNVDKDEKIILYTGRLVPEKGIMELIKSIQLVKTENIRLIVAGGAVSKISVDTPFILQLKEEAKFTGKKVDFIGYVEHSEIYKLYKTADVVVLPSIWEEPAGLTMIEASAAGAKLITTDVGGIKEYISDDSAIILKNNECLVENIAKSIDLILENKQLASKLKNKGIQNSKIYNFENYYKNFMMIINED